MSSQQRNPFKLAVESLKRDMVFAETKEALAQPQEALKDIATYGQHISIGGKRIDPADFYIAPEQPQDHSEQHLNMVQKECRHCGWLCKPNDNKAKKWYPLEQQHEPSMLEEIARLHDVIADLKRDVEFLEQKQPQPQGSWVDLTDDEILTAANVPVERHDPEDVQRALKDVRSIIAKFKEKNTPPVVPQVVTEGNASEVRSTDTGEPVEWMNKINGFICKEKTRDYHAALYTATPSVEALALKIAVDYAIETTKEKAAKVCDGIEQHDLEDDFDCGIRIGANWCAAAIRSMK